MPHEKLHPARQNAERPVIPLYKTTPVQKEAG